MSKIEKSLVILDSVSKGGAEGYFRVDPRSLLLVTVIYLCMMLAIPTAHIDVLLWFALYPIIASPLFGLKYSTVFLQSLIILPVVVLLGIFNPIFDKTPVAPIGGLTLTNGWLLFIGIIVRGLLSMQALLILIRTIGFIGIVRAMGALGVPRFLTTQLLMVFRYIRVLIEEGASMKAARDARSYGNKKLSIKLWGVLVGQLFLRSVDRAERVHKAMLSRGFNGEMPVNFYDVARWNWNSTFFLVGSSLLFLFLRLFNLSLLFVK